MLGFTKMRVLFNCEPFLCSLSHSQTKLGLSVTLWLFIPPVLFFPVGTKRSGRESKCEMIRFHLDVIIVSLSLFYF